MSRVSYFHCLLDFGHNGEGLGLVSITTFASKQRDVRNTQSCFFPRELGDNSRELWYDIL